MLHEPNYSHISDRTQSPQPLARSFAKSPNPDPLLTGNCIPLRDVNVCAVCVSVCAPSPLPWCVEILTQSPRRGKAVRY